MSDLSPSYLLDIVKLQSETISAYKNYTRIVVLVEEAIARLTALEKKISESQVISEIKSELAKN